jgi:hypothetical protein
MATVNEIRSVALGLPESERTDLALELFESLPPPPGALQSEEELSELIRQRQQRIEQGDFVAYDWQETLAHLDQALAQKRRDG